VGGKRTSSDRAKGGGTDFRVSERVFGEGWEEGKREKS